VITSPPYWDILLQRRTADYKERRHYGDAQGDLGKVPGYEDFLSALRQVFEQVAIALGPGKYCCVVVMDVRKKNRFYPLHADVAAMMQGLGFLFDDVIIWDRRHEYNNLRPLGYPYRFRINKVHEFILIFQKPLA
jgi:DNA modification methylase